MRAWAVAHAVRVSGRVAFRESVVMAAIPAVPVALAVDPARVPRAIRVVGDAVARVVIVHVLPPVQMPDAPVLVMASIEVNPLLPVTP